MQRASKYTEDVVTRHFYSEFGLEAELIDAGVMDKETKVIKDPRRVLNGDETPQGVNASQKGARPKVGKRQGKSVRRAGTYTKENVSLNATWDLHGHLYGLQVVTKRKELSEDLVAEPPRGARAFDDTTDLAAKQSRYCLLSRTKDGMQTQASFIEYLEDLDRQITAHSKASVADGGEPIERPVVLCLDNQASRFSEEVLTAASSQESRLGIRMFTEEPGTSGFLQSLDQYNGKLHRNYNKALGVYKEAFKAHHSHELATVSLSHFLKVLGGCHVLGVPGMWFSWADPFDSVNAWRKVGIAGNKLVPSLINRDEFVTIQPTAAPTTPTAPNRKRAAELALTPDGMESGSLASERAKVKALLTYSEELETEHDARFCPAAAGLLVPDCATRPDKSGKNPARKRMSQLHGSTSMRNLAEEAKKRREEDEEKAQTTAANKQQRLEKKEEKKAAAAEEAAGFAHCEAGCKCKKNPCPYAGWKRCPECGPKKGECRARACIAARGPLLLGWNQAAGEA